jgi:DNA topoisomerase-1
MDYGFTARIEEEFDEVAEGKMKWNKMIDDFYNPFKKDVEKTIETAERVKGRKGIGNRPDKRQTDRCPHGKIWAYGTNRYR